MNISITPSFKGSIQFSKDNQRRLAPEATTVSQPTAPTTAASLSFGSTQVLARNVINVYTPLSIPKVAQPVVELKPTKESIVGYLNSIYDRTSGYVVQNYEARVAGLSNHIDDETVAFAYKIVSMVKKRPANANLNAKLSNMEIITSAYKKMPEKRQRLDALAEQYDSAKNNAMIVISELASVAKA